MPPKRSTALKRGPGRPPKNEVKASPKAANQKKAIKTSATKSLNKTKTTPAKSNLLNSTSKASTNKSTCPDCNESFSSIVLFKKHQLNCGAQEKIKIDSKKRAADVQDDIEIISAKMGKQTDEIENDVEIIGTTTKKSEDRLHLQAFMSNKVQSLLSSASPGKNLGLGKTSKDTSLWKSKPENSVSISASSLRKNIALSLQKNDLAENSKSRRGRKPNEKNQSSSSPAQKSIQSTFTKITSKTNEAAVETNAVTSGTSNKNVSKNDQSASSTVKNKSNDSEIATKDKSLSTQESAKTAQELLKTPARRGRPPKKLHEEKIKEVAMDKSKNKPSEVDNTNIQTSKNEGALDTKKDKEKAETVPQKTSNVTKRRGRPPKKIVQESTAMDSGKTAGESENELEIEMEIGSDSTQLADNSGIKITNVESVDVSVKEEDDGQDTSAKTKKSKQGSDVSKQAGSNNKDTKSDVKESSANESATDTPTVFHVQYVRKHSLANITLIVI